MFTEDSQIFTPEPGNEDQVVAAILSQPHGEYTEHDIRNTIVPGYFELCMEVGVPPILAIAQMIHETGNLTSFWSARPQRNPAGIGVDGRKRAEPPQDRTNWAFNTQRQMWEFGISFPSWRDDAIPAHVGRLLAYALAKGEGTAAQRELIDRALRYRALPDHMRGSAPNLKRLGKVHNPTSQGWASPGVTYGARIAAIAERIVRTPV